MLQFSLCLSGAAVTHLHSCKTVSKHQSLPILGTKFLNKETKTNKQEKKLTVYQRKCQLLR